MLQNLRKQQKGFTIIEVLIVLAIAGLILLIVFLAVPALQRNSRNTQRSSDASKIGGSISACLSNRNGQAASCNTTALITTNGGFELNKMQQATTVNVTNAAPTDPGNGNFTTINAGFNSRCQPDGSNATGGSARQAAVLYRQETGDPNGILRCVDV